MPRFLIGLLLLVAVSSWTHVRANEIDPVLLQRIRSEAIAKWAEVGKVWRSDFSVDGSVREIIEYRDKNGQKKTIRNESSFSLSWDDARRIVEQRFSGETGTSSVVRHVANERYGFVVQKESGGAFALSKGVRGTAASPPPPQPREIDYQWYVDAGCRIWWDVTLEEALRNTNFTMVSLKEKRDSQGPAVRIEFRYSGGGEPGRFDGSLYWAELRPANSWLVSSSGVEIPSHKARWLVFVEYQPPFRGSPFPKLVRLRRVLDSTGDYDERTFSFSVPKARTSREEEFFLSYYGISEAALDALAPAPSSRVRLVIVGIVGVLLAMVLFWLSTRYLHRAEKRKV